MPRTRANVVSKSRSPRDADALCRGGIDPAADGAAAAGSVVAAPPPRAGRRDVGVVRRVALEPVGVGHRVHRSSTSASRPGAPPSRSARTVAPALATASTPFWATRWWA